MHGAVRQLEDQPAVDGAEAQLAAIGVKPGGVRGAYRYQRTDEALSVVVSEVRPEIRTTESSTFDVKDDKFTYNGRLTIEVLKAGVFSLELGLPPEYDVDSLTAAGLFHRPQDEPARGSARSSC